MTSTTTTNSTSGQIIYLPANTNAIYGGILNNSWTTTTSTTNWIQTALVFDENGAKIIAQISKMQTFIIKYKRLINGIMYKELVEKLDALLYKLSCMWGFDHSTWTTTTAPTWTTTTTPTTLIYTPTNQYTISGNAWVRLNNLTTAASTTGIVYTY